MRATTNGISALAGDFAFQLASVSTSFAPNFFAIAISQDRFENDADADGQAGNFSNPFAFQNRERMKQTFAAAAGIELSQGIEIVPHSLGQSI